MANKGLTGSNSSYIRKKQNSNEQMSSEKKNIYTHRKQRYEIRYSRHKFLMDSREEEIFFSLRLRICSVSLGSCFSRVHTFRIRFSFSFFFFSCYSTSSVSLRFFSCPVCRSVQTDERSKQSFSQKRAIFQQNKYDENEVRKKTKRYTFE